MIGFIVRLLACLILAVGTVFAIGDIARSLSVEGVRLTTMAEAASMLSLDAYVGQGAEGGAAGLFALVAAWPAAPTLGALALLLLVLARRRPEPARLR